jgi:hypothetical protein
VNGQPAGKALVTLFATTDLEPGKPTPVLRPQGWTDAEGRFQLSSYPHAMNDGAPAGDYHVTITWPAPHSGFGMGPDKLGGKYAKADSSGLTAHIDEKTNVLAPFELSVESSVIEAAIAEGSNKGRGARGKH